VSSCKNVKVITESVSNNKKINLVSFSNCVEFNDTADGHAFGQLIRGHTYYKNCCVANNNRVGIYTLRLSGSFENDSRNIFRPNQSDCRDRRLRRAGHTDVAASHWLGSVGQGQRFAIILRQNARSQLGAAR